MQQTLVPEAGSFFDILPAEIINLITVPSLNKRLAELNRHHCYLRFCLLDNTIIKLVPSEINRERLRNLTGKFIVDTFLLKFVMYLICKDNYDLLAILNKFVLDVIAFNDLESILNTKIFHKYQMKICNKIIVIFIMRKHIQY